MVCARLGLKIWHQFFGVRAMMKITILINTGAWGISYANPGEDIDVPAFIEKGQFHEAILSLPTCRSNSRCRTVIQPKDKTVQPEAKFNLNEGFNIHSVVSTKV